MRNKKVVAFLIVSFIIFVAILPTICAFIPYNQAYFSEDTQIYWDENQDGTVNYYLVGEFKNPTICKVTKLEYEIYFYDAEENYMFSESVKEEINLSSGQSHEVFVELDIQSDDWEYWSFENVSFTYTKLSAWVYYAVGVCLFGLSMLLFTKKKFYFEIENHKLEVFASVRKATLVIDGKLYKTLLVKSRTDVVSCKFKIKGKILEIVLKPGNYLPDIMIAVDGVIPKFTKIKQHLFLKAGDKIAKEKTLQ